jgi:hypothetical protein
MCEAKMKLLKMFFVLILFSINIFAQTEIPKDKIHSKIPGAGDGKFATMIYYNPTTEKYYYYDPNGTSVSVTMPDSIKIFNSTWFNKIDDINSSQLILRNYLHPSNKIIGATDSVTTDTTAIDISSLTTYAHLSVYAYGDIYVSLDETVWIPVIANTSISIQNFSPVTFSTIFIRRKAISGTVSFDYTIIGY